MTPEQVIVRDLAKATCKEIARQVQVALQRMNDAGKFPLEETPPLKNVWEQLCVQVQFEKFFSWPAYEQTVKAIVEGCVDSLPRYQREAIWLQTDAGQNPRHVAAEEARPGCERLAVGRDEVIDHVISEYVKTLAMNWSNRRIREYLDPSPLSE